MATSTPTCPATSAQALRVPLPQPVTALLTGRPCDLTVVDAAVGLAAPRRVPVLLVAVLPGRPRTPAATSEETAPAGSHLARVLIRLRRDNVGYIPVAAPRLADPAGRPRPGAAGAVLDLAARHYSPLVVASRKGPAGLDALTLIDTSLLRGGAFVHAVSPDDGAGTVSAGLSPAVVGHVWTLAEGRLPAAGVGRPSDPGPVTAGAPACGTALRRAAHRSGDEPPTPYDRCRAEPWT
ncbi:hypothetical protein BJP40_25575 [Streptomyces sp. CC53]|uniref:hypothetical protein n=1 Tax=unclassified Streptomyces TaxID=2593676 RepID=UPI0008DD9790|nr:MULTISPECIES: hypothetical protein [unclassified Streptomyces]OII63028.1 hypothetical protein BJP40_25575 [Streptomyces sp. CC53]